MSQWELRVNSALAIRFDRAADRYSHTILLHGQPAARSGEGGADDDWPSSPPLQQLSIEDLGAGDVGLLVGMAGRSHWSLSVEPQGDELVFDAACRVRGEAAQLGSLYELRPESPLRWAIDEHASLAKAELVASNDQVAIRVLEQPVDGATVRWRYRVGVARGN